MLTRIRRAANPWLPKPSQRCLIPTDRLLGTGGAVANAPELVGLKLFEIWHILNKRKWLILSIVAACLALNAVRTLMQTPIYTATVRLQIDPVSNLVSRDNDQADSVRLHADPKTDPSEPSHG